MHAFVKCLFIFPLYFNLIYFFLFEGYFYFFFDFFVKIKSDNGKNNTRDENDNDSTNDDNTNDKFNR